MTQPPVASDEERARARYMAMNGARLAAIAVTMVGFAGVREVVPVPYMVSVALVLAGIGAFFFGPPLMVKRWKAQDENS